MGYDFYFKRNLPPRDKSLRLGAMARKISAARRWSVREVRGSVVFNEKSDGHVKKTVLNKKGIIHYKQQHSDIYIYIHRYTHSHMYGHVLFLGEKGARMANRQIVLLHTEVTPTFRSFIIRTGVFFSLYYYFVMKLIIRLHSLKLTAKAPENRPKPNRKVGTIQPSIFRGENVSFREGNIVSEFAT